MLIPEFSKRRIVLFSLPLPFDRWQAARKLTDRVYVFEPFSRNAKCGQPMMNFFLFINRSGNSADQPSRERNVRLQFRKTADRIIRPTDLDPFRDFNRVDEPLFHRSSPSTKSFAVTAPFVTFLMRRAVSRETHVSPFNSCVIMPSVRRIRLANSALLICSRASQSVSLMPRL